MLLFKLLEPEFSHQGVGIYCIESGLTGTSYFGSSFNVLRRLREHERDLQNNRHHNRFLQAEFNKGYPLATNTIGCKNREDAFDEEQKLLDLHKNNPNCLNISRNARCCRIVFTDEIRKKLSNSSKGRIMSQRHKNIISKTHKGNKYRFGKKLTKEQLIKRIGKRNALGYKFTEKQKDNLSLAHPGQKISINGIEYRSYCDAARKLNLHDALIRYRVLNNKRKYDNYIFIK